MQLDHSDPVDGVLIRIRDYAAAHQLSAEQVERYFNAGMVAGRVFEDSAPVGASDKADPA